MFRLTDTPQKKNILFRIGVCAAILLFGLLGMKGLASLKKPPAEAKPEERAIRVEAVTAEPRDYPVTITGYGEARSLTVVKLAPEVAGKVVYTHPSLRTGRTIAAGETLFRIDPTNYQASRDEARAGVTQWTNAVARLKKQQAIDTGRLKTLTRNAQLAKSEFERLQRLFKEDDVGTRSGVDQAEQASNRALDQADQMNQAVSLYPMQIKEAESNLSAARARHQVAATNLERCTVSVPFDARIKSVELETGQYVSPGQQVLTLADDAELEIHVPLDSIDARRWLQFETSDDKQATAAWFGRVKPVRCAIRWTEEKERVAWSGTLNRVVTFDQKSRTLTVAVRITADKASAGSSLPLVEGMFCEVEIPGRTMHQVVRLPRQSVSFQNQARLVTAEGRLKTVSVGVARSQDEDVFVDQGIAAGDTVIVTRLIDPLENSLLEVTPAKENRS